MLQLEQIHKGDQSGRSPREQLIKITKGVTSLQYKDEQEFSGRYWGKACLLEGTVVQTCWLELAWSVSENSR